MGTRDDKPAGQLWKCPKCNWEYISPLSIIEIGHRCGESALAQWGKLKLIGQLRKAADGTRWLHFNNGQKVKR